MNEREAVETRRIEPRGRPRVAWLLVLPLSSLSPPPRSAAEALGDYEGHRSEGRSVVLSTTAGQRVRLTPYGSHIVRVQVARRGEAFAPDDRYELVVSHDWPGALRLVDDGARLRIETESGDGVRVQVAKRPARLAFHHAGRPEPLLKEESGIRWAGDRIRQAFVYDPEEHFTGLGHDSYGRADRVDLRGLLVRRQYGGDHGHQAPLIVPFFLSSKGYGVFLNSMFPSAFRFGSDGIYDVSVERTDLGAQLDVFFILGPRFADILDRYTQLTGRPRLPPLAMFGLALSDKGHDHLSADPSDERWWKRKVAQHRIAGFPLDHVVNDNRWRAGGGQRCISSFDWDRDRFPDPAAYRRWLAENGLVATLDFNRCIASRSEGWKPSLNIPGAEGVEFGDSVPDFTRGEVRSWFWSLFWTKSLDPALGYPGDALWIDEFDELGRVPDDVVLGNGRPWAEMKNYWFFLIAKALVEEGWGRAVGPARRPFVWVRGMTAGAQRYATLWSGDIRPTCDDMRSQIRAMQLAGLSGFPYWGHDAGGFYDWERKTGPDDALYRQWAMAFGSFTPFWKPHGMGESRWPRDRSAEAQADAKRYGELRYRLMPYLYSYAYEAHATGVPIARGMVVDYQENPLAWRHDLQYLWGRSMIVAPTCSDERRASVWLPPGTWYDFWDDTRTGGDRVLDYPAPLGKLPVFVRAGSIVPMATFAPSTAFMRRDHLIVHVFTGEDADFVLYEDDGVSEQYRTHAEHRRTAIRYREADTSLTVRAAVGTYQGAPRDRSYRLEIHGFGRPACVQVGGRTLRPLGSAPQGDVSRDLAAWDPQARILSVLTERRPVSQDLSIKLAADCKG